jgi:hypothetical protein
LAHFVVGEVPIQVGSPEGALHKGSSLRAFLTGGEHMSMGIFTYVKTISSFSFLHVFLNFPDPFQQKIFSWEHKNITGSPPLHNSIGIFCWGRSLKIQRVIKREVAISNQLQYITNLYKYVSFVQRPSFKKIHGNQT